MSTRKPSDFKSELKPIWCPGCGDFGVLASLYRSMADLDLDPTQTVVVSGIGCSSRLPHFVSTYGIHTLHGRPLPVAMGVKLANPELTVIAVGGDGDGFAIGLGHFPHAARRNVDITYLVMDNEIYGLTKGQASPTSLFQQKAPTTPFGNPEDPLNTLAFALSAGASFVARGASFNTKALTELITQAIEHKGFAYINAVYPVVETRQHDHVLRELLCPAPVDAGVADEAKRVARAAADVAGGAGVTGVEMFHTADNRILINELAPRPHNSGHHTIEACVTSQFENHLRGILGLPLGPTELVAPGAALVNLLGDHDGPSNPDISEAAAIGGAHVHLYGKADVRVRRKMGHVTALGASAMDALQTARLAASRVRL